jgi:hypothetical protein
MLLYKFVKPVIQAPGVIESDSLGPPKSRRNSGEAGTIGRIGHPSSDAILSL